MKGRHGLLLSILLFAIGVPCFPSCNNNKKVIRENLKSMMGYSVSIPDTMLVIKNGEKGVFIDTTCYEHCLIIYYDQDECIPCRISHLHELDTLFNIATSFPTLGVMVIISPQENELSDLLDDISSRSLRFPVYIDFMNNFSRKNTFIPKESLYHTFLIDSTGHPQLVGDPVRNAHVMHLLNQILAK